ncbi:MAG TPA: alpha/beta fold hydrolase [Candidatus Limnocylindrales bacterium]|jgi:pimeloyl-ACP methyl ester carboxylesterase|nr:alpha/beta fold hydrolase [Candidatus Limnocylindrales bacterium]
MSDTNGKHPSAPLAPTGPRPPEERPVRKDEIVIEERGLYIESWLPERRSRRRPLYLLHGELGGSWLWERYLRYFAQRGWEGHALNLRAHFWSETADFAELDFGSYLADVDAGAARLSREPVVIGHGMGGLLAMKLAERRPVAGLVLLSPALPAALRSPARPHELQLPDVFRHGLLGWHLPADQLVEQHSDLTPADVMRIQHMLGAESGAARRDVLAGVPLRREPLRDLPMLIVGAGLDRLYPEADSERLAEWLGAEYQPFGAHSHYGLVIGERSFEQVAESVRLFLEGHRL